MISPIPGNVVTLRPYRTVVGYCAPRTKWLAYNQSKAILEAFYPNPWTWVVLNAIKWWINIGCLKKLGSRQTENIQNNEGVKPCTFNLRKSTINRNSFTTRHPTDLRAAAIPRISRLCVQIETAGITQGTERLRIIRESRASTPAQCWDKEKIAYPSGKTSNSTSSQVGKSQTSSNRLNSRLGPL